MKKTHTRHKEQWRKKTHAKNNNDDETNTKCRPTTEGDQVITKETNACKKIEYEYDVKKM